jgi:hypothetical protein
MGDKGYDSKANRQAARRRGAVPVIPYRSTAKSKPTFFPKALYKGRARIEQAVGKLKRFKRVALRCEKTKQNFASIVAIAAGFILIKSVHTCLGSYRSTYDIVFSKLVQCGCVPARSCGHLPDP